MGEIRIIGGKWRGRKLKVLDLPGLRPTPDRVRETLFNWLQHNIVDACCLDMFAGSGALGFEALSRGARRVVMTDQSTEVVALLQEEAKKIGADNAEIYRAEVPLQLKKSQQAFDIVFLDPPFQENLCLPSCFFLEEQGFLAKEAFIYIEAKESLSEQLLPSHWKILKCKQAGQIAYHLILRSIK